MSIKFALLSLLAEQPASVGHLRRTFEERTHDTWPVNVGQVYQTVQRLVRDGLAEVTGTETGQSGRHTEIFAPTAYGLAELTHWWRTPVLPPPNDRDDLVIKTAMAAATTPDHLPGGLDLTRVLHDQRLAILDELRQLTRQKVDVPPSTAADRLQLERRIFDLESQVRWLDQVEALPPATPSHQENP
ncbi:MAG: PadR family transcriptional regulator [Mycobacteriaceae bacterium]|uniref:PadR family transcriptional regulator n=1 Tax=Corynebacterium sp. TaxID=1720 RepID=UPI003F998430